MTPASPGESFQQTLERVARDTVEYRLRTWMQYEFEKVMLPRLLEEATRNVRVEVVTNANFPEDIVVRVRFEALGQRGGE